MSTGSSYAATSSASGDGAPGDGAPGDGATQRPTSGFWLRLSPTGRWSLLSTVVGLLVGGCCIAFDVVLQVVSEATLRRVAGYQQPRALGEPDVFSWFVPAFGTWTPVAQDAVFSPGWLIVVMTLGGLASGYLTSRLCPDAAGAGTDAAVDAFHQRKGIVRSRVFWVKTLASSITLGTGGSGGREGPIAQIGASIGSWLARRAKLSARDRRILLAAGMGAGVGAMFRAPLAGAIFAAEILYSDADMEADVIVPSAIASIVSYSVYTQSLPAAVRYQPLFGYQTTGLFGSPLELLPYLILTLLLLVLAMVYVHLFHSSQRWFASLPGGLPWRSASGALLAGGFGVAVYAGAMRIDPERAGQSLGVLGTGYGALQTAVAQIDEISIGMLATIALGKILTTSLSIGSGGSGGVFGPSMVIGGCSGAAFGKLVQQVAPSLAPHPESFAIVGMAGFFAGVARAPISTIIMIREITGDFSLLVPTLLVATLTFMASGRTRLYRKQVATRMNSPAHLGDFLIDVLAGLKVEDVYQRGRKMILIDEATSMDEIVHRLAKTQQRYFPVVDRGGRMVGIFTDNDVRAYLYDESLWRLANAGDVMVSGFLRVRPSDDLNSAFQKFTSLNLDELPVMDDQDPTRLLGFLRRKETIAAYNQRILELRREIEKHDV